MICLKQCTEQEETDSQITLNLLSDFTGLVAGDNYELPYEDLKLIAFLEPDDEEGEFIVGSANLVEESDTGDIIIEDEEMSIEDEKEREGTLFFRLYNIETGKIGGNYVRDGTATVDDTNIIEEDITMFDYGETVNIDPVAAFYVVYEEDVFYEFSGDENGETERPALSDLNASIELEPDFASDTNLYE